ncbi:MAG: hypothetical protein NTV46_12330 [Verrucomicrobia bacterium]|nr:hypothetical protein [Verrucomicrobiota bacterium]
MLVILFLIGSLPEAWMRTRGDAIQVIDAMTVLQAQIIRSIERLAKGHKIVDRR